MKDFRNAYDQAWFKHRAIQGLKKIEEGVWDYSDSLLLYISSDAAETYEQLQETDTPYFTLVTKPERAYLQSIAKQIVDMLPDHFDYIDLGPGTEHKEQFLFDELRKQGKTFTYIPVDISDYFLGLARTHAAEQGIDVQPVKCSFEELPEILSNRVASRFVSLGCTFSNYNPFDALKLLKSIAQEGGWIFINVQMRDRVNMETLQKVYQDDAICLVDEKARLLDLDPKTDISPRIVDDGFRVWCIIQKINPLLEKMGMKVGDRLMVFQSLRYTKDQLEKILASSSDHVLLDTQSSFIGSMIRT